MSRTASTLEVGELGPRANVKRKSILRGAKQVFLKNGFGGTSMDEVAARAGVSKMTVYRHFGSKESLFAGVITDLCNRIVDEDLRAIFEQEPERALRQYAERMIDIVFGADTVELHRIVIAESKRFPNLGRFFYACGPQVCIDVLASYFKRHRDDPRFRIADPVRTAEEFLELLRGYAHLRVLLKVAAQPSRHEIAARIEGAVRHVLDTPAGPAGRMEKAGSARVKLGRAGVSARNAGLSARRG